jgi:valyl-tRNA synthetase
MNPDDTQLSYLTTPLTSASIWILKKYIELEATLVEHLKDYEFTHSIDALYRFLWDFYADWYVEYLKNDSSQLPFAKELFRQYIITLSPYCPFETEALRREFFGENELLALTPKDHNWSHTVFTSIQNPDQSSEFEIVIDFIIRVRSLRGLFAIDPVTKMDIYSLDVILSQYVDFISVIGRCVLLNQTGDGLYEIQTPHMSFKVDIFAYIQDTPKEISRTNKIIESLTKQIAGLESQLQNQKFLDNAEAQVISEKHSQLENRNLELKDQQEKLTILQNTHL